MNADMLIKARKVFVDDNIVENSEDCPHCKSKGLQKKLRYFYLSLEEKIYKCENSTCLYPFERFMFKSLTDNTVYYYEEVVDDGGRELYFRVPMDRQNDFQASNPLATQLFCDSQRNPSIEDYNCDFSDLFDDINTDVVETAQAKQPPSTENPDALEFLDEIGSINTSRGQNESDIGFDSIIDEILNELPAKSSPKKPKQLPPPPTLTPMPQLQPAKQNANSGTSKEPPKLLKCIQHLDKAKKAQNRKTSEKSKQPFATAMLKARKSQTRVRIDSASTNDESEGEQTSEQTKREKPNPSPGPCSSAGFLKSANNLRPVELARQLSTLKSINTNSDFLRRYMKVKEEKLFADDLAQQKANPIEGGTVAKPVATNQNILSNSNTRPMVDSMGPPISNAAPMKASTTKKPAPRKSVKSELVTAVSTQNVSEVKKKERKPRAKKQNTVVNAAVDISGENEQQHINIIVTEPANGAATATATAAVTKKVVATKRKPAKESQPSESSLTSAETMNQSEAAAVKPEPKKNARKRKTALADGDDTKSIQKGNNESAGAGPSKRQRKPKCVSKDKNDKAKSDEVKPKRIRTPKPEVNLIKLEQPSLPQLLDSDGTDYQVIYTTLQPVPGLGNNTELELLSSELEIIPARPIECGLEARVQNEQFAIPSTSQSDPTMVTVGEHGTANVLVTADHVYANASNPSLTTELIENEPAHAVSANVCDNPADGNVNIRPIENIGARKRQRKSKYGNIDQTEQTQSVAIKPKRGRTPKAKVNPIKTEQPSLPLLNEDMNDPQQSGTNMVSTESVLLSSSQQKVPAEKGKRKSTNTTTMQTTKDRGASKQTKKNVLDSNVMEEGMCEKPSTSQGVATLVTYIPNAADSMHTNELNPSLTTQPAQHELVDIQDPSENVGEQQPKSTDEGKCANVGPAKRQRRSNVKVAKNENVETKPKRGRASKSKTSSIKVEKPSSPLPLNVDVIDSQQECSIIDEWNPNVDDDLIPCHIIQKKQHQSIDASSSSKCIDACESASESVIPINSSEDTSTEPKKNVRKRKSTYGDACEPKKGNSEKVGPTKRQRKSKDDTKVADQAKPEPKCSLEVKPKRSRTTKSKANPIESDQAASLLLINAVTDSQGNATNTSHGQINDEKGDPGSSKQQENCTVQSQVMEETSENLSTSQMKPVADTIEHNYTAANDLIAILDDSVHLGDVNSYQTTEAVEQEFSSAAQNPHEQPSSTSTYGQNYGQLVQPKLEPMSSDATSSSDYGQNRKQKSTEASEPYYRRKVFKKVKEEAFHVDDLLDEWDENFGEQQKTQTQKDPLNINYLCDNDEIISIASGTSDSSFTFIGEPYYDGPKNADSDQTPTTSSNQ